MTMETKKIRAVNNEQNQQNVDVFTMTKVQKYILAQRAENTDVKITEYELNVWRSFSRNISKNREIEYIPADELNILIYRFMMDMEKKDAFWLMTNRNCHPLVIFAIFQIVNQFLMHVELSFWGRAVSPFPSKGFPIDE